MNIFIYPLFHWSHPVASSPTLQTDPAGYNDDKSAQIFMSIEFHFVSAHGSLSAFSYTFLGGGHCTSSQTIIICAAQTHLGSGYVT